MADRFPCRNCEERHFLCHSECPTYLKAKRVHDINIFKDQFEICDYERDKKNKSIRRNQGRKKY